MSTVKTDAAAFLPHTLSTMDICDERNHCWFDEPLRGQGPPPAFSVHFGRPAAERSLLGRQTPPPVANRLRRNPRAPRELAVAQPRHPAIAQNRAHPCLNHRK